jgi:uncharacterized radical SAM protein YgiQ
MFLPTTRQEMDELGWDRPDIILVSGDTWIDSPFMGIALVGHHLTASGFKVAVIAQPDIDSAADITRLGEPTLFWGVTGGAVDSMVANYTASGKRRKKDDYTPGGENTRRPDRAVIAYTNLIRRWNKNTVPIVLGGIEASLRRIAHYDSTSRKIRRSILLDAKADYLIFGMGHNSVLELACALRDGQSIEGIRGLARVLAEPRGLELPSFEETQDSMAAYARSFELFYNNMDAITAEPLCQKYGNRWLVLSTPPLPPTQDEMDALHDLNYERAVHPFYAQQGEVRAMETLRFSIPSHYGCYGECNFCAIAVHQGRTVSSRSKESIVQEAKLMAAQPDFKGYIHDLGGPTANMYGFECQKKLKKGACADRRCLYPTICPSLRPDHGVQLDLLAAVEAIAGVKKVFVSSGIRQDLILADHKNGARYIRKICRDHVSGQLKLAPEHTSEKVLRLMGKPDIEELLKFKEEFDRLSKEAGKKQFLTYYFIAAHPGCTLRDMEEARVFCHEKLGMTPEQVQIFTPTPSTWSTLMYATGKDFQTGEKIFVERDTARKEKQKGALVARARDGKFPPRRQGKNAQKTQGKSSPSARISEQKRNRKPKKKQ